MNLRCPDDDCPCSKYFLSITDKQYDRYKSDNKLNCICGLERVEGQILRNTINKTTDALGNKTYKT